MVDNYYSLKAFKKKYWIYYNNKKFRNAKIRSSSS